MKSVSKSLYCPPNDKVGSSKLLLNFHAAQKLKENDKEKHCKNSKITTDISDKKEIIEGGTHPTVGIETISEVNLELGNDKTEITDTKETGLEIHKVNNNSSEKKNTFDSSDEFNQEILSFTKNLQNRKTEVLNKIEELKKEKELLNKIKDTPYAIYEYISSQRNLKEHIKNILETGSTIFEPNNPLPPFSEIVACVDEIDDSCHKGNQIDGTPVFVTQKTEGYKKEKEKLEKARKRDEKFEHKEAEAIMQNEEFGSNFHRKISNFDYYYNQIPSYNYGGRDIMSYAQYQQTMIDPYRECFYNKEFKGALPILSSNIQEYENKIIYPSQSMLVHNSPSLAEICKAQNELLENNDVQESNKNQYNCDLIGKEKQNDQLIYDDIMNKDYESLFKDDEMPNIAHNAENNSNIIENFSQEEILRNSNDLKFDELFDESNSMISSQPINSFNLLLDDSKDDDFPDEISDKDNDMLQDKVENDAKSKIKSKYHPHLRDNEKVKNNTNNYSTNRFVERIYPLDDMMKSQMYPNKQYLGGHLNSGYIGTERKFENYPQIEQNGLDTTSYYKSQKIQRSDFIGSNNFKDNSSCKGRKRNKYKMLPTDIKHKAVELAQNRGAKYSAMFYSVPLKSLKRWMKVGCERKKGGGRKTKDPLMEKNLYNWYREKKNRGENITAKMIKERAIELTNCSDFIASKGWLDKFKVRFNLEISKESSKDYNKRRSLNDSSIKRDEIEGIIRKGYNDDIDHYKSYRRSLNKSLHPEFKTVGNRFQNEDSKRITYDGNNSLKTPQKSKNVYNEDLTGVNNNRKKLKNENLSSLFPSIQNDNQFKKSKRIEKSSNNIINLPLCDLMQSEEEYS